ncbi:MAG: hypothetical protein LUQ11_09885 [Methylococcaceae bacterium]|nr:hypothetical protein [Methylococcaceae bacterium]
MAYSNNFGRIMKTNSETTFLDSQLVSSKEPGFPTVRYFQIHFEHLHELIDDLRMQIQQANQQIAELQQQLHGRSTLARIGPEGYGNERKAPPTNLG